MNNTLLLTFFWPLVNDSVRPDDATRLYGIIGLGGVTGGLVGATIVRSGITTLGRETVLLLCILPTVAIAAIGYRYARRTRPGIADEGAGITASPAQAPAETVIPSAARPTDSLFGGLRLLASSRYLLAICLMVAFYEIASSLVDFQLSATVEREVTESLERDRYFGFIAQVQSVAAIVIQIFFTSFVMRRLGVGAALMALPVAILCGSVGYLLLPTLTFATLMSVSDNSMNYSINQSAKETLYVPTAPEEKYQAKAFIDMFVQRFAKVIAVFLNLGLVALVSTEQVRWLSVASILILTVWISMIRFAGRHFEILTGAPSALSAKAVSTMRDNSAGVAATRWQPARGAVRGPLREQYSS
jgi:AAA family ATP:ADP antiporter